MNNPLKKIIYIFVSVILVPVLIFIVYEVGSLNKNEEIIRDIYRNQLDAILYSVNQYSDDIVNSWANGINMAVSDSAAGLENSSHIHQLFAQNPAIHAIAISDSIGRSLKVISFQHQTDSLKEKYENLFSANRDRIKRLITYQRGGFRKIEPLEDEDYPVSLLFLLNVAGKNLSCLITIDPSLFITSTLAPKMQAISQEKFVITAFNSIDHTLVYATTEELQEDEIFNRSGEGEQEGNVENIQLRDFWLIPDYYLGISMKDATIDDLVRSRARMNLSLISVLIFLLLAGLFLIYRNLKKEMQLSQAKSEFVSNVSHEIRTPLSLISMFAETLAMNRVKTEEKKQEYYEIIGKETSRLSAIVNRILNFSQMEAHKKRYVWISLDLNQLVGEVLYSYDFHLHNKGFTYQFVQEEGLENIYADKDAVAEAIINLLDNAIKYSNNSRHIDISTGEDKKYAWVEVKDYGIGISKNHQKEVFDQFYRVPTGDIHNIKGSGLGLTLVKKIVEAHNGKISLNSSLGKGSAFRLYFPFEKTIKL